MMLSTGKKCYCCLGYLQALRRQGAVLFTTLEIVLVVRQLAWGHKALKIAHSVATVLCLFPSNSRALPLLCSRLFMCIRNKHFRRRQLCTQLFMCIRNNFTSSALYRTVSTCILSKHFVCFVQIVQMHT